VPLLRIIEMTVGMYLARSQDWAIKHEGEAPSKDEDTISNMGRVAWAWAPNQISLENHSYRGHQTED
jgi:hypothetical protein